LLNPISFSRENKTNDCHKINEMKKMKGDQNCEMKFNQRHNFIKIK